MEERKDIKIEENYDEILKNIIADKKKNKDHASLDKDKEMEKANATLEFEKIIENISLEVSGSRVVYIDGNYELVYDNGEFFVCSILDINAPRKKLTKKQAIDKYVEYFIRYQLNPILEIKRMYENIIETEKNKVRNNKVQEKDVKTKKVNSVTQDKKDSERTMEL